MYFSFITTVCSIQNLHTLLARHILVLVLKASIWWESNSCSYRRVEYDLATWQQILFLHRQKCKFPKEQTQRSLEQRQATLPQGSHCQRENSSVLPVAMGESATRRTRFVRCRPYCYQINYNRYRHAEQATASQSHSNWTVWRRQTGSEFDIYGKGGAMGERTQNSYP